MKELNEFLFEMAPERRELEMFNIEYTKKELEIEEKPSNDKIGDSLSGAEKR